MVVGCRIDNVVWDFYRCVSDTQHAVHGAHKSISSKVSLEVKSTVDEVGQC
jgi:hypothetical protein